MNNTVDRYKQTEIDKDLNGHQNGKFSYVKQSQVRCV